VERPYFVVDAADERLEFRTPQTGRLRHRVAGQSTKHLQIVQVAEQVLQALQSLHGPGQPEPSQPLATSNA